MYQLKMTSKIICISINTWDLVREYQYINNSFNLIVVKYMNPQIPWETYLIQEPYHLPELLSFSSCRTDFSWIVSCKLKIELKATI